MSEHRQIKLTMFSALHVYLSPLLTILHSYRYGQCN
jgi:hypothetical protein